jgi:hypothetical protein
MRLDYVLPSKRMRVCKGCSTTFAPRNGHTAQVYCTNECYRQDRWKDHDTKQSLTCKYCERGFQIGAGRKQTYCSRRCAKQSSADKKRGRRAPLKPCSEPGCTAKVRQHSRCGPCQIAYQRRVELESEAKPIEPGPKVCGLLVRGGVCWQPIRNQVNRDGLAVIWCLTHGERIAPRYHPGDPGYPEEP